MTNTVRLLAWLALASVAHAQMAIPLWPDGAPGALGKADKDVPTLTPQLAEPSITTGAAMIIFPGGGYGGLAPHEGKGYADWFVTNGISCFVVKYRLGSGGYRHPSMLQDAARAVRLVRSRAEEWKIDPKRVGVIGSSAGGHLVSTLITHFDSGNADASDAVERQSSRPDLAILCYPVITMGANTHAGSKKNLLGDKPDPELVKNLSNELQVTKDTPPCFIWHTWEDKAVKVENSLEFAAALQRAGVPFDLHIYQNGAHGIGLGKGEAHPWANDCMYWLRVQGFVK
ncbi:MAG TPA: alpha/beta hydrolase [Candidatus Limnocylindria bacterium]|nr:alpha/beta hydrolase [Candidatus Limnocylindria bacterium]